MSDSRGRVGPESTGLTRAGRAQLPLLDRLMDADPSEPSDRPLSAAAAMDALRASICSDLEELLNTRRRWRSWDPHLAELERSLVGRNRRQSDDRQSRHLELRSDRDTL